MKAVKKKRSNELELISRFVNSSSFKARVRQDELERHLGSDNINKLIELGILREVVLEPTHCEKCGTSEIDCRLGDSSFIVKCNNCGFYSIDIRDRKFFDVSYEGIVKKYLDALDTEEISIEKVEDHVKGSFVIDGLTMDFLFIPVEMRELDLLSVLYSTLSVLGTSRVLIIVNDRNFEKILNMSVPLVLGSIALVVPLSHFNTEEIKKWIYTYSEILKMEEAIMEKVRSEELSKLIVSVNTNPKYALTLLAHLKMLKAMKAKEFNWKMLENVVASVIRYMYASDISLGGHRDLGKDLPDSIFYVIKGGNPEILGLIDCKSSQIADISRELTEKHLNYLERARKVGFLKRIKKVLVFVVFDVKGNSAIKFYERMERHLEDSEYILILPVETLMLIVEIYLNWAIKSELQLRDEDKNIENFIKNIFDLDYLKQLKRKYESSNSDILVYDRLFRLNSEDIISELKEMVSSSSSYVDILKHYAGVSPP